ncbi:hypothetical protein EVJ58_g8637 [Rhodofomes roseus]|uniref:Alcohol dehydrogenase iron-type/glycerol dehydrogenase GldA domain-containing protein n=1 Tax=Rhodofomes roseus TaxID=34475 RepID=A0A4Y9XXC8_9APHY|nr:hypothetical protein EVJ58_g8637 [Rhodofomes roseus]
MKSIRAILVYVLALVSVSTAIPTIDERDSAVAEYVRDIAHADELEQRGHAIDLPERDVRENSVLEGRAGSTYDIMVEDRKGRDAIFGADYVSAVSEEVDRLACSKVYLVVSRSLDTKTDVVGRLEQKLGGKVCGKKVGVKSHTPYDEVLQIAKETKERGADIIVTLGSSSYSDAAKAALIAHASLPADKLDIESMESLVVGNVDEKTGDMAVPTTVKDPTLKLICVPTSLSAAEWNANSGCTNPSTHKKQHFTHPACAPNLIVLDPQLALTTPLDLWLSTGERSSDDVKQSAEEGLRALTEGLLKCKQNKKDASARAECQVGAWKAMRVIAHKVPLGASHAIGHQRVCAIFWSSIPENLARAGLDRERADAGDLVKAFVKALGLPTTLTDVDVGEDKWDAVAKASLDDVLGKTNPVRLETVEQVKEILAMAK